MSVEEDIDHESTSEAVCPHCGFEYQDSWEWGDDGDEDVTCERCEKHFSLEVEVHWRYSTRKLDCDEGTHVYLPAERNDTTQDDIERYKREGSCLAKYITEPRTSWRRDCAKCADFEHVEVALGEECPESLLNLPSATEVVSDE